MTKPALCLLAALCFLPALCLLPACDRGEAARSNTAVQAAGDGSSTISTGGQPAGTAHGAVAGGGTTAAPACLLPTPSSPAPDAQPASDCPAAPAPPPEMERLFLTFADAPGAPRVNVEHAQTNPERSHGLMYRTDLPQDEGMLFSWTNEAIRSFWMRNTCLPLDMLFINADNVIVGILEQVPVLNDASRSVRCPAQYVLEMNAGWSRRNGVVAGQHVLIDR